MAPFVDEQLVLQTELGHACNAIAHCYAESIDPQNNLSDLRRIVENILIIHGVYEGQDIAQFQTTAQERLDAAYRKTGEIRQKECTMSDLDILRWLARIVAISLMDTHVVLDHVVVKPEPQVEHGNQASRKRRVVVVIDSSDVEDLNEEDLHRRRGPGHRGPGHRGLGHRGSTVKTGVVTTSKKISKQRE